ncbi:hypothetical protein J3F81_002085 [Coemansia sp. RSA 371]|nr:hypothetical protein J3F81_002085 [Coemansia sp. RSA 371]
MEVVTVTRPGVTRTTLIGPAPTIDQQDGNKADVGASGNQTSIIVATVVTAVALLLCTVLYYLYKRRKKSLQHGDDGFFAKGGERANTISTASPFIPPGDGYVDARRTDESGRSQFSANDNTHLLAPQQGARYQQQQMGMVSAPMGPSAMTSMAPMAPMAPMGQGSPPNRYTSQPQPNMHATGYAPQPHSMRANTGYDASLHPAPRPPILQSNVFSPQPHHNMS